MTTIPKAYYQQEGFSLVHAPVEPWYDELRPATSEIWREEWKAECKLAISQAVMFAPEEQEKVKRLLWDKTGHYPVFSEYEPKGGFHVLPYGVEVEICYQAKMIGDWFYISEESYKNGIEGDESRTCTRKIARIKAAEKKEPEHQCGWPACGCVNTAYCGDRKVKAGIKQLLGSLSPEMRKEAIEYLKSLG